MEGDFIKRENYGRTLRKIAKGGAGVLYNGEIAESIVETVQSQGGVLSLKDVRLVAGLPAQLTVQLQQYQARITPAVHQTWNGKTIYTTEAPSSCATAHRLGAKGLTRRGSVMLGMLNILEPYDIPSSGCRTPENIHKLIEAHKFAFGARSEVTDPPFASNLSRLAEFRTKAWADKARAKLTVGPTSRDLTSANLRMSHTRTSTTACNMRHPLITAPPTSAWWTHGAGQHQSHLP